MATSMPNGIEIASTSCLTRADEGRLCLHQFFGPEVAMKIPEFLYGKSTAVMAQCRKRVEDVARGVRWEEVAGDSWIETHEKPGVLVLEGPVARFARIDSYCCFGLGVAVLDGWAKKRLTDEVWESLYEAGLKHSWLFLTLLGQHGCGFLHNNRDWLRPFLRAAVGFWPMLDAEGERYTFGRAPSGIWQLPTTIGFALARLGVAQERINSPLPAGGLAELAASVLRFEN